MRNKTYNLMLIAGCLSQYVADEIKKQTEERIKSPYLFEPFEHQVPIIAAVPTLSMAAIFVAHRLLMIKKKDGM
ncbi:unnamed protein product [Rhizophagus irregularis]|nr:unnamed protein product [Rhizophagus irregularis]